MKEEGGKGEDGALHGVRWLTGGGLWSARPTHRLPIEFRRARRPCCGAQNFCAALRRALEILTAATRSPCFIRHRRRSVRSPRQCAHWPRNDMGFYMGCGGRRDTWVPPYIILFCRAGPVCPAGGAVGGGRRGEGTPPLRRTRRFVQVRAGGQGRPPLRRGIRGAVRRAG